MQDAILNKLKNQYPQEQYEIIKKAYDFAKNAHAGQKRQSGEDYFVHPVAVSEILIDMGLDYETIMAAFLHDVIEDTPHTQEELEGIFGKTVVMLVNGVTKLNKLQFKSSVDEQAENLRKMLFAMSDDIRVIIIKLADRLHNMRTLLFKSSDRQKEISRETLDIYAPIAERLGMGTIKGELEDLAMRYLNPDDYYALVQKISAKKVERQEFVQNVVKDIKAKLAEMKIDGEVNGRPKHFYSIYKKMQGGKEFEQIYDLIAVRIIVDTIKDCYAVLGAIHTMWKPLPGRFKDYIAMPKANNYQSLHTTVISQYGSPFEIQIRTHEMHDIAEFGIAAHWKYKEGRLTTDQSIMDNRMQWIRSIMEVQKDLRDNAEFLQSLKVDLYPDEVFVITPKGKVVSLPKGATGIDFAYAVHTEVGNKCVGIKVDGKIVPINTRLTNNSIVEVITSNASKGPSRDWLKFVATASARNKIRAFFKKEMREDNIKRGREMLEREAKHRGYSLSELLNNEEWLKYFKNHYGSNSSMEDIYAELGYGNITTNKVILKLIDCFKKSADSFTPIISTNKLSSPSSKKGNGILIRGYDDFLIRLSHCCNPVPGDKIVGYVSRGRGVSIHRADCPNMKNIEAERIIEASWSQNMSSQFTATLEIICINRSNLLVDITTFFANRKKSLSKVNAKIDDQLQAIITIGVEITNINELDELINKLRGIEGVVDVHRIWWIFSKKDSKRRTSK